MPLAPAACLEALTWTVCEASCPTPAEINIPWVHPDGYRVMSPDKREALSQSSRLVKKSKPCKEVTPEASSSFC